MVNLENAKILIAEDTAIQGKKLKFYLEKFGFSVDWALNGREALNLLQANDYDLVITDVQMPEMDGVQLVEQTRLIPRLQHVPFIVVTTLTEIETKIQALQKGANDFLNKPYSNEELELRVKNLLSLHYFQKMLVKENSALNEEVMKKNVELTLRLEELQTTHAQLKEMQTEIIRASRMSSIGLLGAGVAHEINNPLSIISGYNQRISKIIQKGEANLRSVVGLTEHIESNVQRIASIVQRLLRFTRSTEIKTTLIEVDLNQYMGELEDIFSVVITKNDVFLQKEYSEEPIACLVNETTLSQCLLCLIQNAVEAITDQADKKISVKSSRDQSHGYIYVIDNGPGIPNENQDKIFSPFFTTKTSTTRGVGLGLSLALVYMREMGGDILFETGKNGSTFILKIPLTTAVFSEVSNG